MFDLSWESIAQPSGDVLVTACSVMKQFQNPGCMGWKNPADPPQFVNAEGCCFRSLFGDENKWHFVELQERAASDPEEVDEEREVVLRHVTTSVARSIKIGMWEHMPLTRVRAKEVKKNVTLWNLQVCLGLIRKVKSVNGKSIVCG